MQLETWTINLIHNALISKKAFCKLISTSWFLLLLKSWYWFMKPSHFHLASEILHITWVCVLDHLAFNVPFSTPWFAEGRLLGPSATNLLFSVSQFSVPWVTTYICLNCSSSLWAMIHNSPVTHTGFTQALADCGSGGL